MYACENSTVVIAIWRRLSLPRLFFLLILRPPRSTPLPCTTRCRSRYVLGWIVEVNKGDFALAARLARFVDPIPVTRISGKAGRDRKSTRLNSSHANISYAVFCLKKKKNNHNQHVHYYY